MPGQVLADNLNTQPNMDQPMKEGDEVISMQWKHVGSWIYCMGVVLAGQQVDQTELLKKARLGYYSLSRERMDRFQCTLVPNWKLLLEELKVAPEVVDRAVEKLKAIQFTLTVDRHGAAAITHTTVAADNDQMAAGLKQVYSGMEEMTSGFFQTWSVFMVHPPLPDANTPSRLEELGIWYLITYMDGASKVETTVGKDFAVSAMKVVNKDFHSTINPLFSKTPKGFVLVGYQAAYRGASAAEATDLNVALENQELDGFTLPKKMDLRGSYGSTPFHVEVSFLGGRVTKY